jgi:hypothetical protein
MERGLYNRGGNVNINFAKLCRRTGGYKLAWLITLSDPDDATVLRVVNNNADVVYGGHTYTASTFNYLPGEAVHGMDGGGTLDIVVTDNAVIDIIETYRSVKLEVVGVLVDSTVSEVQGFSHTWGSVSWDGKKASFTFEKDEKLTMTFPAILLDPSINRGNAGSMTGARIPSVNQR